MVAVLERPTPTDRIRAALWFAERGFGVFSVWSTNDAGVCRCPKGTACDNAGKHPITERGFHDATLDPTRITTLLSAGSEPNYGLVCPDGVFALDVDGEGVARLAELEATHGPLPPTLRTDTAHGQHVFLRWPQDVPRPIGQLFGFVTRWGSGRDAGYVIGPRSVHASGAIYRPAVDTALDVAEIPAYWAAAAVSSKAPPAAPPGAIVIEAGGYVLPERVAAGESRYEAIRAYTAHLYNRGLSSDEMWPLVLSQLAPRFEQPLSEPELRSRFQRTTSALAPRLGEPRAVATAKAAVPRSAEEISASSIDAVDLLALDIPPLTWIVPDLIPEGSTVLAGPPKLGKSCLVYQVAVEVAIGGDLLGRVVEQGDVLYLALEDGKRRGQTRLRSALGDRPMPRGRLEVRWSAAKLGEGLEQELVTWLEAHPSARLVAIDTLQRVRPRGDARRNAYEVDVEDLARLQDIFKDRAVGLLIVHHSKKDAGDDFLASVSGTYGITGSVDTTLVIQRKRLESFGKLVVTGRDVPEVEDSVQFNGMTWTLAPESLAAATFEQGEVYKVIEAHGPIFAKAIADVIDSTRDAVQKLVEKLVARGSVVRASGGYIVSAIRIVPSAEGADKAESDDIAHSAHSGDEGSRARRTTHSTHSPHSESVDRVSEGSGDTRIARPHEASPTLTLVPDEGSEQPPVSAWCHFFVDHQSRHRDTQTTAPWCEICSPREVSG